MTQNKEKETEKNIKCIEFIILFFFNTRALQTEYLILIADCVLILNCHIMRWTRLPLLNTAFPCQTCRKRSWPRKSVTLIHSGGNSSVQIFSLLFFFSQSSLQQVKYFYIHLEGLMSIFMMTMENEDWMARSLQAKLGIPLRYFL